MSELAYTHGPQCAFCEGVSTVRCNAETVERRWQKHLRASVLTRRMCGAFCCELHHVDRGGNVHHCLDHWRPLIEEGSVDPLAKNGDASSRLQAPLNLADFIGAGYRSGSYRKPTANDEEKGLFSPKRVK